MEARCYDNIILVFDIKNCCFQFSGDIIPNARHKKHVGVKYTVDKDDLVCVRSIYENQLDSMLQSVSESFQYSNDKLVHTGIDYTYIKTSDYSIFDTCFV